MGLFGKLLGTALDVVTTPIAVVKDVIPGAGGFVDGNDSHTEEKLEQLENDYEKIREDVEDL